jgi:hypothetical protein
MYTNRRIKTTTTQKKNQNQATGDNAKLTKQAHDETRLRRNTTRKQEPIPSERQQIHETTQSNQDTPATKETKQQEEGRPKQASHNTRKTTQRPHKQRPHTDRNNMSNSEEDSDDSTETDNPVEIDTYRTKEAAATRRMIKKQQKRYESRKSNDDAPLIQHKKTEKATNIKKPRATQHYQWSTSYEDSPVDEEEKHNEFMNKYYFHPTEQVKEQQRRVREAQITAVETTRNNIPRIPNDQQQVAERVTTQSDRDITSSDDEIRKQARRGTQGTNLHEHHQATNNPYGQTSHQPINRSQDSDDNHSERESDSTRSINSNTDVQILNQSTHDNGEGMKIQASAWREIFRKYRIRSIPKDKTIPQTVTQLQPILFQQSDNEAVGDDLESIDETKTLRIYYQNVNGITASKGTSKWNEINETMVRHKVAIFGLTETNIEWNKYKNQTIMKSVLRKHFKHATMQTSTTTMKFDDDYKPGGTCTVITNDWTGRVLTSITDETGQGRWSGIVIRAHWFNIAIITAYRVTQRTIEQAGPTTAYAQQWAVLRQQGIDRPEPRQQFITDIKRLLKNQKREGNKIILMMDANESMGSEKNGVSSITSDCDLIDIHTARHSEAATTATYARGTRKIDFVLITPELLPLVSNSGMLPFYDGIHTDHRGMFIDLDSKATFHGKIAELYSQPSRILTSKFPKAVYTYRQELWKQLQAHNIMNRSEAIYEQSKTHSPDIERELNNIANTVQIAMIAAEKKCKKPPSPPYSDKLAALNKIIRYWKTVESHATTGRNVEETLRQIQSSIPEPMQHLTIRMQAIRSHLRKAIDMYRKAVPNARELRQEQIRAWAEAAAKRGKKTLAQHFKSMANAEQAKATFRLLQNVIKPQDKSGIKRLQVPTLQADGEIAKDDNGNEQWKLLTDPEEIEKTIIARNINHFGQADSTPFNSKEFTDIFGIDGDSEETEALLRGELPDMEALPIEVQLILKEIAKSPQPTLDPTISCDDLKSLFKNWKETTSTSPSGCHLGHWHALLAPDGTRPNPDDKEDPIEDNIMRIHTYILNTSIESGIPPNRWAVVHSSMIWSGRELAEATSRFLLG